MKRYKVVRVETPKLKLLNIDEQRAENLQDLLNAQMQTGWKLNCFVSPAILGALGFKSKVVAIFEQGDG